MLDSCFELYFEIFFFTWLFGTLSGGVVPCLGMIIYQLIERGVPYIYIYIHVFRWRLYLRTRSKQEHYSKICRNLKISLEPRNQEPRLLRSLGDNLGSRFQENLLIRTKILPKTSVQSWLLVSWFQKILRFLKMSADFGRLSSHHSIGILCSQLPGVLKDILYKCNIGWKDYSPIRFLL